MIGTEIKGLKGFRKWLASQGAEILPPTNEWEVLRFRYRSLHAVAYTSKKYHGRISAANGDMKRAWDLHKGGENLTVNGEPRPKRKKSRGGVRQQHDIAALVHRDGDRCFFCGGLFPPEGQGRENEPLKRTVEHLVARAHGGPEHLSNKYLAHSKCNQKVGHLSAVEKIKTRDKWLLKQKVEGQGDG